MSKYPFAERHASVLAVCLPAHSACIPMRATLSPIKFCLLMVLVEYLLWTAGRGESHLVDGLGLCPGNDSLSTFLLHEQTYWNKAVFISIRLAENDDRR